MTIQGKQALADYLGYSYSMVDTQFPTVARKCLANGIKISRIGRGANTIYEIEKVEPQIVDPSYFSYFKQPVVDLPGEVWIPACNYPDYQVSNMGRVKNSLGGLNVGSIDKQGYVQVSMHDKKCRIHRIILQSFNPQENFDELTVDHINGIRSDNRLENLRWATNEKNTFTMLANRADLHKELTRIIQKYGYEETKKILQSL